MAPHWGYGSDDGPAVWGRLSPEYALCAIGNRQSPIDIVGATPADVPVVAFHYQPMKLEVRNNGHTIEVASTSENWIDIDGARYDLTQFHFHTPGEHTVEGRPFDMEVHLVHRNAAGTLAVVGVLVRRGDEHPVLDALAEQLPKPGESLSIEEEKVAAFKLLPRASRIFRYEGSLTTPPCSEGVQWLVLQTPVEISDAGLAAFEAILGNNSRPVQPLNGRELLIDKDLAP
ncbi:MAG: carbonic anhydrase family protein [Gammaproteobacteria bacterium]|nr:carbonic anhydrase family protein [Gammaproteobacteria bacterium]